MIPISYPEEFRLILPTVFRDESGQSAAITKNLVSPKVYEMLCPNFGYYELKHGSDGKNREFSAWL